MDENEKNLLEIVDMLDEYSTDPVSFVRDVLGGEPTEQQLQLLNAAAIPGSKLSVRSGHGTGKTTSLAWLMIWFLCCFEDVKIPCTAPSAHQLFDALWPEIAKWKKRMNPLFADQLVIMSERIYIKGDEKGRYAVAKTARKENPEALAGLHADNILYIIDEASGVPEEIFETAEGALSTKGARVVMTSNPTRTDGYFYRSHHSDRKFWETFHFSCINSPLVDQDLYVTRMKDRYGEGSSVYQVRVLGNFPESGDDTLIPLSWLEESLDRDVVSTSSTKIAGLDVARFGDDNSALVIRQGGKIIYIEEWGNTDLVTTAGKIEQYYRQGMFDHVCVDAIGLGSGVVDILIDRKVPTIAVNVAESASYKEKYNRLRDELWYLAREFFQDKMCCLPSELKLVKDLISELSIITYEFTVAGKIKVEGKKELKKRLGKKGKSPNLADALCLTFHKGKVIKKITVRRFKQRPSMGWT